LRARHEAQGLRLHTRTGCPSWQGEPLDVVWAIDVLHPLTQVRSATADGEETERDENHLALGFTSS
jgi:hypothetical protein